MPADYDPADRPRMIGPILPGLPVTVQRPPFRNTEPCPLRQALSDSHSAGWVIGNRAADSLHQSGTVQTDGQKPDNPS